MIVHAAVYITILVSMILMFGFLTHDCVECGVDGTTTCYSCISCDILHNKI